MNWYIASRVRHKRQLKEITDLLTLKGETVVSDWIYQDFLKPYEQDLDSVQKFSKSVVTNILAADIFILISDAESTDMFVELGIALAGQNINSSRIYIVGKYSKRSLMQLHFNIIHVDTIQDIIDKEGIECRISAIEID
jgi:hypothetical protein